MENTFPIFYTQLKHLPLSQINKQKKAKQTEKGEQRKEEPKKRK